MIFVKSVFGKMMVTNMNILMRMGANHVSLKEARQNYINFGVSDKDYIKNVRQPNKSDIKDPNWKPLE